jgi:hypothetical protein
MRPSEAAARALIQTWGANAPSVVSDYLKAFPEGSKVLKDIEAYAGVFRPGPKDSAELQRMEGRREVFLWIRTLLSLTPSEVDQLIPANGEDDAAS